MPSLIPGKRTRLVSLAAAGTLSVAGAISAAALTLPSTASAASAGSASAGSASAGSASAGSASVSPAFASLAAATQQQHAMGRARQTVASGEVRLSLGIRQYAAKQGARQAAARAAAAKAAQATAARGVAAKAAAKAAATVKTRAAAPSSGSPQQIARTLLGKFGWAGSQFSCLEPLWGHESRWSVSASNPGSGAYGIPQALPGSRMSSAGPDWQSNAETQIKWGLQYIKSTYGSPCGAWSHEQSAGWY